MRRLSSRGFAGLLLVWGSLACDGDPLDTTANGDPATLYARLTLEHAAILLSTQAPYDTVQLRAVPRNAAGDVLPYTGRIEYRRVSALDTSVAVDSSGFVTVRKSSGGTLVEVSLTLDGVTRSDTATIIVSNASPVRRVGRIEFFPLAPDSAWRWAGNTATVNYDRWVRAYDTNNVLIPSNQVVFDFSWDNELIVRGSGAVASGGTPSIIGETYIRARVYAFGTELVDSVLFRRIDPPVRFMVIGREFPSNGEARHRFHPDSVEIKAGSTVMFMNAKGFEAFISDALCMTASTTRYCGNRLVLSRSFVGSTLEWVDSTDVVFDQPAQVSAGKSFLRMDFVGIPTTAWPLTDNSTGNIAAFGLMRCVRLTTPHNGCGGRMSTTANTTVLDPGYRSRTFNTPGVYRFHSTRFPGAEGVIVVRN